MPDQIREETGYDYAIIYAALHALERDGTVVATDPFYKPQPSAYE